MAKKWIKKEEAEKSLEKKMDKKKSTGSKRPSASALMGKMYGKPKKKE